MPSEVCIYEDLIAAFRVWDAAWDAEAENRVSKLVINRLVAGLLLLALGGCGGQATDAITVAGTTFPNTTGEEHWLTFQRNVESAETGSMDLRMLIYGQLGSEEQIVSGLRRGRVHFANLSALVASTIVPEFTLLYAPFLFDSEAEADYVYDNYLTELFRDMLAPHDLHLMTWYEIGFLNVYGKTPIIVPDDAIGKRFRVGNSEAARLFAEAIGGDVIPLGYGEVVSSLQTGLIEAGENSISLYARTGIAGEAPHVTITEHSFGISLIVTRKSWWDSLTGIERQVLTDAFPAIEETRRGVRVEAMADLENGIEMGIVVHELTPVQAAQWRLATAGVTRRLVRSTRGRSAEILELIDTGKREFAESQAAD